MARMSCNDKCPIEYFGDSSQFTNWFLYSVATCHITTEVSDFIPGSLEDTNKHIDIITFAQFEEGDLLSKTRNDVESGDKSDDDSIMKPLLRK